MISEYKNRTSLYYLKTITIIAVETFNYKITEIEDNFTYYYIEKLKYNFMYTNKNIVYKYFYRKLNYK